MFPDIIPLSPPPLKTVDRTSIQNCIYYLEHNHIQSYVVAQQPPSLPIHQSTEKFFQKKTSQPRLPSWFDTAHCIWSGIASTLPCGLLSGLTSGGITACVTGTGDCVAAFVGGIAGAVGGVILGPAIVAVFFGGAYLYFRVTISSGKAKVEALNTKQSDNLPHFQGCDVKRYQLQLSEDVTLIEHQFPELPASLPNSLKCPGQLFTLEHPVFIANSKIPYSQEYVELLIQIGAFLETTDGESAPARILSETELSVQQRKQQEELKKEYQAWLQSTKSVETT